MMTPGGGGVSTGVLHPWKLKMKQQEKKYDCQYRMLFFFAKLIML